MSVTRTAELAAALGSVKSRLAAAAAACSRNVDAIELLPITKFFPASDVIELHRLGCVAFGESREREASSKMAEVDREIHSPNPAESIRWHMVGRIQRNKANAVTRWAHTAHAVDGAALVTALDRGVANAVASGHRTEPMDVYVQVSFDGDPARGGIALTEPHLVDDVCGAVDQAAGLRFVGLMAVPPLGADAAASFARMAEERDRLQPQYAQRLGMSAGMSSDLEAAVEHGSTCVRVGTALLGQRPLASP